MSTNIDIDNTEITLGGDGLTRCRAQLPLVTPPGNCIGLRVAMRPFFDSFTGGAKSPWTVAAHSPGVDYRYSPSVEHSFALGFAWASGVFPEYNTSTGNLVATKGFLGFRAGRGLSSIQGIGLAHNHNGTGGSIGLGSIANWMTWGGTNAGSDIYSYLSDRPVKPASSQTDSTSNASSITGFSIYGLISEPGRYMRGFPSTRAGGDMYTLGIEIIKGSDYTVNMRWCADAGSISEDSLLNVFSDHDYISSQYRVSRSSTTEDADDAFYNSGAFTPPTHIVSKFHAPSGSFNISGLKYEYIVST
jgi:hypothetical protein